MRVNRTWEEWLLSAGYREDEFEETTEFGRPLPRDKRKHYRRLAHEDELRKRGELPTYDVVIGSRNAPLQAYVPPAENVAKRERILQRWREDVMVPMLNAKAGYEGLKRCAP